MAVIVVTPTPNDLLSAIKAEIKKGSVDTWSVDTDGDFTHTPAQWLNQAWFRPNVQEGRIVFVIFPRKGVRLSRVTYGIYHGRFIEMLLMHFDLKFSQANATALPSNGDNIGSAAQ